MIKKKQGSFLSSSWILSELSAGAAVHADCSFSFSFHLKKIVVQETVQLSNVRNRKCKRRRVPTPQRRKLLRCSPDKISGRSKEKGSGPGFASRSRRSAEQSEGREGPVGGAFQAGNSEVKVTTAFQGCTAPQRVPFAVRLPPLRAPCPEHHYCCLAPIQ
jgi:hypothetical protein